MRHVLIVGRLLCVAIPCSCGHAGQAVNHFNVEVNSNGDMRLQPLDAAAGERGLVRRQTISSAPPKPVEFQDNIFIIRHAGGEYLDSQKAFGGGKLVARKERVVETQQFGITCLTCDSQTAWNWDEPGHDFVLTQVSSGKALTHGDWSKVKLDTYSNKPAQQWGIMRSGNLFKIFSSKSSSNTGERILICDRTKPIEGGFPVYAHQMQKLTQDDPTSDVWKWNITLFSKEANEMKEMEKIEQKTEVKAEIKKVNKEIKKAETEISKAEKETENAEEKIEEENKSLRQTLSEADTIVAVCLAFGPILLAALLGNCKAAAPPAQPPAAAPAAAPSDTVPAARPLPVAQGADEGANDKALADVGSK